jgi:hypothetical protein
MAVDAMRFSKIDPRRAVTAAGDFGNGQRLKVRRIYAKDVFARLVNHLPAGDSAPCVLIKKTRGPQSKIADRRLAISAVC